MSGKLQKPAVSLQTILLQDKQKKFYCVACQELNSDIDKDNPGMSRGAERACCYFHSQLTGKDWGPQSECGISFPHLHWTRRGTTVLDVCLLL